MAIVTVTAGGLDVVTAFSTAAAALVAAWAVLSANRTARESRERQRLERRYDAVVDLLQAYEQIQFQSPFADPSRQTSAEFDAAIDPARHSTELKAAQAECTALLRACEEPLPITRGAFFDHMGFPVGVLYDQVEAYLADKPLEGNPETEDDAVRHCRGEIVATINALREQLNR